MTDTGIARDGGCRCGQLRFRVTAAPLVTMACHCTGCQRMTASAFSLSAAIPTTGFAVIQGESVSGGLQKPPLHHHFCPSCKSWVYTRFEGLDHFVNVRTTLLDEPGDWATPFVETVTDEKLPWVTTPAPYSYPQFPPMEAWEELTRAYGEQQTRSATPPPLAG